MLNIVIPMAGAGSRFARAGYSDPKPLIPIKGSPMIQVVIENLRPSRAHRFIFVCQAQHVGEYHLAEKLSAWAPGSKIVQIDGLTDGAARTVLAASHFINNDEPLMIANSDQWIDIDIEHYLDLQDKRGLDGLIMTMTADDPKWSYVQVERNGLASKVVEKKVISNEATVGIYNFARGSDFVSAASEMIAVDDRSNGEFYVAPVYNYMIEDGAAIGIENIGTEGSGMYGLGIPEDLEAFYRLPVCERAIARIAA